MSYVVTTFYHFFDFPEFEQEQADLKSEMLKLGIKGSLLIASEGINGTLSGTREDIDAYLLYLKTHITKGEFEYKESMCERQPFGRAKVRLKKEVISFGAPIKGKPGKYVEARDWNALINSPDVVLLDTRNDYEVHIGKFKDALNPNIRNFKELRGFVHKALKPAEHKRIATYCTGGIRCEKFSAWLLEQGFAEVYQLKGGILKYLEGVPEAQSQWQGECYVFDDRVALVGLLLFQAILNPRAALCAVKTSKFFGSHWVRNVISTACLNVLNASPKVANGFEHQYWSPPVRR